MADVTHLQKRKRASIDSIGSAGLGPARDQADSRRCFVEYQRSELSGLDGVAVTGGGSDCWPIVDARMAKAYHKIDAVSKDLRQKTRKAISKWLRQKKLEPKVVVSAHNKENTRGRWVRC